MFNQDYVRFRGPMIRAILEGRKTQFTIPTALTNHQLPCQPGQIFPVHEHYKRIRGEDDRVRYEADEPGTRPGVRYCEPLTMKRRWSRISIQIGEIRPGKLYETNQEDLVREAFPTMADFRRWWNRQHRYNGNMWEENPPVWRISFTRIKPERDEIQTPRTNHF